MRYFTSWFWDSSNVRITNACTFNQYVFTCIENNKGEVWRLSPFIIEKLRYHITTLLHSY